VFSTYLINRLKLGKDTDSKWINIYVALTGEAIKCRSMTIVNIFVWCENARTNDGENPEITIPKSKV